MAQAAWKTTMGAWQEHVYNDVTIRRIICISSSYKDSQFNSES